MPAVEADIGIIAPYNAQGYEIRQQLKTAGLKDVKVGPVEEFQGQVRLIHLLTESSSHYHP